MTSNRKLDFNININLSPEDKFKRHEYSMVPSSCYIPYRLWYIHCHTWIENVSEKYESTNIHTRCCRHRTMHLFAGARPITHHRLILTVTPINNWWIKFTAFQEQLSCFFRLEIKSKDGSQPREWVRADVSKMENWQVSIVQPTWNDIHFKLIHPWLCQNTMS